MPAATTSSILASCGSEGGPQGRAREASACMPACPLDDVAGRLAAGAGSASGPGRLAALLMPPRCLPSGRAPTQKPGPSEVMTSTRPVQPNTITSLRSTLTADGWRAGGRSGGRVQAAVSGSSACACMQAECRPYAAHRRMGSQPGSLHLSSTAPRRGALTRGAAHFHGVVGGAQLEADFLQAAGGRTGGTSGQRRAAQ